MCVATLSILTYYFQKNPDNQFQDYYLMTMKKYWEFKNLLQEIHNELMKLKT